MNQSETNFYRWLIDKKNYNPNEIEFRGNSTPDFNSKDEEWEVKKLYGNRIRLYSKDQVDYVENGDENSYIAIMPENPKTSTKPLFIIPCTEISIEEEPLFKDLEDWCIRDTIPTGFKYRSFSINIPNTEFKRMTISLKNEEIVDKIDKKVNNGEYKNRSRAVETLLREVLNIETIEPF